MLDVSSEDITEGNLTQAMLLLAVPLVAQGFVRVAEQVIDLFWLGRLSGDAVAGVGLAMPVYAVVVALVFFAPMVGTQVVVSQRVGGGDSEGARRAAFNGVLVAVSVAALFGVAGYVAAEPAIAWLASMDPTTGGGVQLRDTAAAYLRVLLLGLSLAAVSDVIENVYIAHGDSKTSLYMNALSVAVIVVLDPLLIFGIGPFPRLEVQGAALATVAGWAAGLALGAGLLVSHRRPGLFSWPTARLHAGDVRELLEVGVPTAAQQLARQTARFAMVVVVFFAGGAAGIAAYYVGARVATVAFVPAISFQQAVQSVVGQNLGADRPERADRATWTATGLAVAVLAVLGAVQWFVPGGIIAVLAPELSGQAAAFAVDYLTILAYGYPAIGAAYLLEAGFNGARRTRVSFVASLLQFYAVRLPIAVAGAFALGFGVHAVFWAVTVSNVVMAVGLAAYYRHSVSDGMLRRAVDAATAD
ncbi:MATE family efflux transporter [Halorarius litoreus]|uniref:MATE family efflux transporter n=1 Tax=Halorarius litoreus TaxID=2962676 RepID=UPI0020CC1BA0|nr:MATE family efflux transporter [Halorarius litoreus]